MVDRIEERSESQELAKALRRQALDAAEILKGSYNGTGRCAEAELCEVACNRLVRVGMKRRSSWLAEHVYIYEELKESMLAKGS
jgi:hypothetical protein